MENNLNEQSITNIDINNENFFELDYEGQDLKTNNKFQSWKKKMINLYGKKSKMYKCIYDNTYFYTSNIYEGEGECPLCKKYICYYCSLNEYECCARGNIYHMMFQDGAHFIGYKHDEEYCFIFVRFLFPIYTFCYLSGILSKNLFYVVYKETGKEKPNDCYFDESNCACMTSIFINAGFALVLSLIFFLHDIYFKILLILFSLFCKNYPLKWYLGILKRGIDGLS